MIVLKDTAFVFGEIKMFQNCDGCIILLKIITLYTFEFYVILS
uniref:Macaca fascicularis brain cDNA clone: QmoA-12125, similar to human DEAD (Asp-Glu-Ala-Asp) box polypeptide 51 (DDX51), mRNA, RefSeq: NM_175066.2 n=1 Tax=Macaca fascicularis TaxID=9541 RepID=I7GPB5_MACFA|nr:unnamed protein product [Macaca fascicularis]